MASKDDELRAALAAKDEELRELRELRAALAAKDAAKDDELRELRAAKDAALAAKDDELRELRAAKDAALAAKDDKLRCALAAMTYDSDVRRFGSLRLAKLSASAVEVQSPSKQSYVRPPLFDFSWGASTTDGIPKLEADTLALYEASAVSPDLALKEDNNYEFATAFVPAWINSTTRLGSKGSKVAAGLFLGCSAQAAPSRVAAIPGYTLNWGCYPELMTTVSEKFRPAFNGELKSAMSSGEADPRLLVELATYCMLATLASLFCDVPEGHERFYTQPPLSYGLAATSNIGYLVAFEWVGRQCMSIISQPFFLGSPQHQAAITALPCVDFSSLFVDVDMRSVPVAIWSPQTTSSPPSITWTTSAVMAPRGSSGPGRFYKILAGFEAAYFNRVRAVYRAYADARRDQADPPPDSLLEAQFLYGAAQVCVSTPFVSGADAPAADFGPGGRAVEPVATALAWLARHGLLYTDLRRFNVRIAEGSDLVVLIDYDDMVLQLDGPITTFESFHAALVAEVPAEANYLGSIDAPTPIGAALRAQQQRHQQSQHG